MKDEQTKIAIFYNNGSMTLKVEPTFSWLSTSTFPPKASTWVLTK
jgi:hypothetical protein